MITAYRSIGASPLSQRLGRSGIARKAVQYTLRYQRKVQCQDAKRQQHLAFVDPFPIAKTLRVAFLNRPMIDNAKL